MSKHVSKHLVCALAMSCAWVTANAADPAVELGPVTPGIPLPFSGVVAPAGDFSDMFAFTLPVNAGSGYSVMNLPISIPGVGSFNTLLNTMALISNPDGALVPNGDELGLDSVIGAGVNSLELTFGPTAGGPMFLQITGITNGSLGGIYNGAISVSAIPEPEVWAMMLVGAGLVGFQLRRKSKRAAVQRFV